MAHCTTHAVIYPKTVMSCGGEVFITARMTNDEKCAKGRICVCLCVCTQSTNLFARVNNNGKEDRSMERRRELCGH